MITWGEKQKALIMAPFDHALDWNEGTPRRAPCDLPGI